MCLVLLKAERSCLSSAQSWHDRKMPLMGIGFGLGLIHFLLNFPGAQIVSPISYKFCHNRKWRARCKTVASSQSFGIRCSHEQKLGCLFFWRHGSVWEQRYEPKKQRGFEMDQQKQQSNVFFSCQVATRLREIVLSSICTHTTDPLMWVSLPRLTDKSDMHQ